MTNSKPTKCGQSNPNLDISTDTKVNNNPEDLWDWCCTEVYRLDNGEDVWKQINKVHQLALKEQREEDYKKMEEIINNNPIWCPYCFNRVKNGGCTVCDEYDEYFVEALKNQQKMDLDLKMERKNESK